VTVEITGLLEAADDRILAGERWSWVGREGIAAELEVTEIYAFRDGLIVSVEGYLDRNEALQAAGLSES
jgi:hypothetical protein